MTGGVDAGHLGVLLLAARSVVHVAEVVFPFDVVLVVADKLVFIGELEQDREEAEEFDDDFAVAFLDIHLVTCVITAGGRVRPTRLNASISAILSSSTGGCWRLWYPSNLGML